MFQRRGGVLRVLHIVPTLFDEKEGILGGAERYAWELARTMSSRVDTTLLSFGLRDREERVGALRVRVLGNPWRVRGSQFNPFTPRIVPEVLRADVIHCHQQHVLVSSISALVGRLTGRKVFATELGGGGWDFSSYMSTDRWFHGHLHISEFSKRVFGHGSLARARVIFSGVDTDKFSPNPAIARTGGILFVGRLLPHKGVDRVLEALPPDIPMDIVGRPYSPEYMAVLGELAKGKQVTFHHDFDDVRLLDTYQRARCIVLPSLYKDRYGNETNIPELMGQTLLEGMSCGVPAICTDVAAMPESVVGGETGFVVRPDDSTAMRGALVELYGNGARAAAMGAAARKRMVAYFGWPAVVQRCLDAYEGRPATQAGLPAH
jgi:glycosyltransferase involved in cell wall biosynthesis